MVRYRIFEKTQVGQNDWGQMARGSHSNKRRWGTSIEPRDPLQLTQRLGSASKKKKGEGGGRKEDRGAPR